jgi:hypothetical protein
MILGVYYQRSKFKLFIRLNNLVYKNIIFYFKFYELISENYLKINKNSFSKGNFNMGCIECLHKLIIMNKFFRLI